MTREEALKIVDDNAYNTGVTVDTIDDIYDDFQSRICENCKHLKFDECMMLPTEIHVGKYSMEEEQLYLIVDKDFGCNKFERKQND